jgi:DNA recombination-dependent growth factor C
MWFKQLSFYRLNGESLHETGKLPRPWKKAPSSTVVAWTGSVKAG